MTTDYKSMVRQFHEAFGETQPERPTLLSDEEAAMRCQLLVEEVKEFIAAMGCAIWTGGVRGIVVESTAGRMNETEPNLVAAAHELADILYIAFGTAVKMGLPMAEVFAEVHAANMRKVEGPGLPKRRPDGKILKPEGWQPADVAKILDVAP